VQRDRDDDAWRAIVDNYGDRVELDDEPPLAAEVLDTTTHHEDDVPPADERVAELDGPDVDDDAFVPPAPPPLPHPPPDRLAAWSGLFGAPVVLLICLVVGIHLPTWVGYLLVAAFLGGFGYLVVKMPRGPADPWDDGARL
jgi:hypothetical protein